MDLNRWLQHPIVALDSVAAATRNFPVEPVAMPAPVPASTQVFPTQQFNQNFAWPGGLMTVYENARAASVKY